jgi:DNA-binding FrmR family transcriptional regulator
MSTSELNKLKNAQYHLDELEKMISGNKWYSQLYQHIAAVEGELQRQVAILENLPKAKAEDIKDTEKLYDVLENQTTGFYPPDTSYTSLSRVGAAQKHEELLASGVSPNDIKIVRVK